ncbi:hypothetical protein WISP_94906 [Willisornis vidua]|uniref:Uncharacterized protein n=1 Tax=Willisornis vidua TaxID=1566151 RepID=A0ABQ9D043_9PASS|nr:hypothetical protein WISP_94906 [Willisornis vidua]
MSGMLPAASKNWKEMSLSVSPLQKPFFQPRASNNPEAAGQEQEGSQEATLTTEKSQEESRGGEWKAKRQSQKGKKKKGPYTWMIWADHNKIGETVLVTL